MAMKVVAEKFKKHKCPAPESCPVGAITQKDENAIPIINESACIECGMCTTACENGEYILEE